MGFLLTGLLVYNTLKPISYDACIGCIEFALVNEFAYSVAESDCDNCCFQSISQSAEALVV